MSPVGTIALSGLNAASLRVEVAARNIANMSSRGPLPGAPNAANFPAAAPALMVDQTDAGDGGTRASVTAANPGTVTSYDPDAPFANGDGMVAGPNVDLGSEIVNLLTARISYAANVAVLRTDASMSGSLLDALR